MSNQPSFDFEHASPFAAEDITARKHGMNAESVAANLKTNKERDRERVIDFYKERGLEGATCEEVSIALGMRYTTASARISELRRDEMLTQIGKRNTTTGSPAGVLVLAGLLEEK